MTTTIRNPILPGFHPDPSILRVGDDYFIASSTFEWWPGVRIHSSRDLVNWHHAAYALTRTSQLDLRGNPDSCGVWAPDLTWHDGTFYLVYSNLRSTLGMFKDVHNFVVTAPEVTGPWSEPTYLGGVGFDASFFHDDDRTYLLRMKWDYRPGHNPFAGIFLREYSREEKKLVGPEERLWGGSSIAVTEGPHLYKREGWYYLLVAEGGTYYEHAVSIARSRSLTGPYELSPHHPLLTSFEKPRDLLQRSGHGSLVETPSGESYLAHLCGRPIEWQKDDRDEAGGYDTLHCPLGRETAIQRIEWTEEGWPRLAGGGNAPAWEVEAPSGVEAKEPAPEPETDDFDSAELGPHLSSLRVPPEESWVSLTERPGFLRLYGRDSFSSLHDQSLIARRLQHFHADAETVVEFEPESFQQLAGLVVYYNTHNWAFLRITRDEEAGKILGVTVTDDGAYREDGDQIRLEGERRVSLRVSFDLSSFRFSYALGEAAGEDDWKQVGPELPLEMVSDEHATRFTAKDIATSFGFTGTFVGLACQDFTGSRIAADFDSFGYRPR
jgi:xylan 1,4-beta-xylosidase